MIKGRYVALVEIEFAVDEDTNNLLPFEQMRENVVNGGLTHELRSLLLKEMFDPEHNGVVKVTQQYADVYKVEEEN